MIAHKCIADSWLLDVCQFNEIITKAEDNIQCQMMNLNFTALIVGPNNKLLY